MKLSLTNQSGSFDVTELVTAVQWEGSGGQCARTLAVGLLAEGAPDCALGCRLTLREGERDIFTGIVLTRTRGSSSSVIDLTAFDYGIYLKQNQTSKRIVNTTPEEAVAALCKEFGLRVGPLAATGVEVRRTFFAKSLYEIIMTLYTDAARATGKKYFVSFEGTALRVLEMGAAGPLLLVRGGSNLLDASTTERAEQIVNRVAVYDADGNLLRRQDDAASTALYGVMQRVVVRRQGEDEATEVASLLKGAQPEQSITVDCLGDVSCVSGGAVMVQEPVTGLCGRFYIDGDLHRWQNGTYTNRLTLNLNAVMDEQEAGEELAGAQARR